MDDHHHNPDDAALVASAQAGDREAFEQLLRRYEPSLLRLCYRLLGSAADAQDVAQETALQAFLGLGRLREPARAGAWLHAVAANLARMALRRRTTLPLEALDRPQAQRWLGAAPTPEEAHAAREIHAAVVAALAELSSLNREVVIGFYMQGYSYAELAELLAVPVSTVKGRLFKGRRQLRQSLAPLAREVLPRGSPRKEQSMQTADLLEVTIDSVRETPLTQFHRLVVLRAVEDGRVLPIFIGDFEGQAIGQAMQGSPLPRPMTHDLTVQMLHSLGAQVRRVVISRLLEKTFYAEITLLHDRGEQLLDARPSDALALAARVGAPIFVARAVADEAAGTDEEAFWSDLFAKAATLDLKPMV
ncbi:MAG TPA: bifunctional nuclease domain-containing protein [Roseiflexaceae bacterium]|nr:bifunctional nuclease domain-containing protein [Roseiflexaceae bacterium]